MNNIYEFSFIVFTVGAGAFGLYLYLSHVVNIINSRCDSLEKSIEDVHDIFLEGNEQLITKKIVGLEKKIKEDILKVLERNK